MAGLFAAMKARLATTVILVLFVCVMLSGCATFAPPLGIVDVPKQPATTFRLYVSGAVEREGYVEVVAGSSYDTAIRLAGLLKETVLPSYAATTVNGDFTQIVLSYYDGEKVCDSINANSLLIANRLRVYGISDEIVNKLADYIDLHGKISNKQCLAEALGDDYQSNYYKFFVAEKDYEEGN